ncbi:MAG: iron-containing alcohol dehydrogenase [Bacteroidales bacterium]|nr:iron-containing alcohol dehydrogenase [Bacteroidales bacterium]
MKPWTFHSAGSLIFGRDSLHRLGASAVQLRVSRIFIVTDTVLTRLGYVDRVVQPLREAGLHVAVFDGGVPEPPDTVVQQAVEAARTFGPDAVLGLGGGSNMDIAKLTALLLTHGGSLIDYAGDQKVPGPVLPVLCVPTTAGTGSEVSPAAVFTDATHHIKLSCLSPYLRPTVAVVDPLLTVGCPPQVTADSGIDALTHAIEAYTAVDNEEFQQRPGGPSVYQGKNPLADAMASECITLVGKFLRRAVKDGQDLEAREGMALAATLGGLAFSNAGVALVHAMEYPVGGAVHVSHGAGNGLLLPYVMRYNLTARVLAFANIAILLGVASDRSGTDVSLASQAVQAVEELRTAIGIPSQLRELGVTEEMLPGFAEKTFGIKRLMRINPRYPESADEILAIYQGAL